MNDDDIDRAEYEARTGMSPEEYEVRFVGAVREQLAHPYGAAELPEEHDASGVYWLSDWR